MITGIIVTEECTPDCIVVFWTIDNPGRTLEEDDVLQSVAFPFAGQNWRVLLAAVDLLDTEYIDISLSRMSVSFNKAPCSPHVHWQAGILDKNDIFQYDRRGLVRLETSCKEWMTVADWPGPEWSYMCGKKDLYMPDDTLTVATHLRWDSGPLLMDTQDLTSDDSTPKHSCTSFDDVFLNVRNKMFHVQRRILEMFSPFMDALIFFNDNAVLQLPDCDPKAFEVFISFVYSEKFEGFTEDMIEKVYYIADEYEVAALKKECARRLLINLSVASVCDVLDMAERYHDEELRVKATEFFLTNAREVFHTPAWLQFMVSQTRFANDLIIRSHEKQTELGLS